MNFIKCYGKRSLNAFSCLKKRALGWFIEKEATFGRESEVSTLNRLNTKSLRAHQVLEYMYKRMSICTIAFVLFAL